ncbi:hypothetical protein [Pararhizobium sp. IMCC21322]|nr:hypothetical protein [Pararhizobium sp. IMCC21322]
MQRTLGAYNFTGKWAPITPSDSFTQNIALHTSEDSLCFAASGGIFAR